jgi:hypothetical protein
MNRFHAHEKWLGKASLLRLGETYGIVAEIINRVPLPQESISKNSKRTYRLREIHAHECRDARALNFEDVVERSDGEIVAGKSETHVGEAISLLAINRILSIKGLLGTYFAVPV